MIINNRVARLFKKLKRKEYRDAFVEESINVGIPFQIRALREQEGLTQKDFEIKSGIKQARISLLEDPSYSSFTLKTLKKIASIYDVGLIVRFVPISELVEWKLNLDLKILEIPSYEEDPYFKSIENRGAYKPICNQTTTIKLTEATKKTICNTTCSSMRLNQEANINEFNFNYEQITTSAVAL